MAQLPFVDEDLEVGVVDDVAELRGDVAEVEVDRHGPGLVAADHGLDPLGAVSGEDADMGAGGDPGVAEVMGEAVGPGVELGVGEAHVARHQGQPVRHGVDHQLEQVGEVERSLGHRSSPLPAGGHV